MRTNQLPQTGLALSSVILVRLFAPSGEFTVCSGTENVVEGGITYQATGTLGKLDRIKERSGTESGRLSLSLDGLPVATYNVISQDKLRGSVVHIHLRVSDATSTITIPVYVGTVTQISVAPIPTLSVTLDVGGRLAKIQKSVNTKYTHVEQTKLFPGDKGLEFVNNIQNVQLEWGR